MRRRDGRRRENGVASATGHIDLSAARPAIMIHDMETSRIIDVMALDANHRRALEEVIGVQLQGNQRLTIDVTEISQPRTRETPRPRQTVQDWTNVYEGLTDEQIEEIDRIAKTRANLTRDLS